MYTVEINAMVIRIRYTWIPKPSCLVRLNLSHVFKVDGHISDTQRQPNAVNLRSSCQNGPDTCQPRGATHCRMRAPLSLMEGPSVRVFPAYEGQAHTILEVLFLYIVFCSLSRKRTFGICPVPEGSCHPARALSLIDDLQSILSPKTIE